MQFKIASETPENSLFRVAIRGGQFEIFASGEIDPGATERFQKFAATNSITDAIVLFDSPGGSLSEGMRLGRAIRSMRFNTGVGTYGPNGRRRYQGVCASSCAYAFAGGEYRFYYGNDERIGIHQFYSSGDNQADMGDTQLVSSILIDYLQSMGVNPQAFVVASSARGDSMFWLTEDQATALGLANNGADPTVAEIKMAGSSPYLRLEQTLSNVTTRILFGCDLGRVTLLAGIVTTPDLSREKQSFLKRTYLETDSGELMAAQGKAGTSAVGSVLWLDRLPTNSDLVELLRTNQLGVWTESGGPMRWGATIDLRPVKQKMAHFMENCLKGN
ncbi:hypothetical protein [Luteimonas sp. MC1750]|uniref:COG3904 family protein n=1 Tax=Luteimonas sp. MC1750 TaxID=2799326 RepID=UPI0018F0D8D6|nr:hypothetical protein [Luteimonas sp. MC1750]MBJ6985589.1 hypothetical protein [Luteimonas sp. MC1750]QQO05929.1 hypothetical protein JGR68_00230 [Luteimonas sp. MC1750]